MPRPDADTIASSVASTVVKLTTPPVERKLSWAALDSLSADIAARFGLNEADVERYGAMPTTVEELKFELRRTVRELFEGEEYTIEDRVSPYFPSTSANYILSRSKGGAVDYVVNKIKDLGLDKAGGHLRVSESWVPDRSVPIDPVMNVIGEEKKNKIPSDCTVRFEAKLEGVGELESDFAKVWFALLREASVQEFYVEPIGLAEALKVRVITKGNPAAQTVMKSLQRKMFKVLAKFDTFKSLTCGGDLSMEFLQHKLGNLRPEQAWLSGDYEAATDNLRSWVSETIVDEICEQLHIVGAEHDICRRLLTGHVFVGDDEKLLPQKNGQLMGSIVSFPVLCIANAALCRLVVEVDRSFTSRNGYRKQTLTVEQAQTLINGDDLLLKCSKLGRWYWHFVGTELMGLKESVGKTYYSREFVEMNSRLSYYDADGYELQRVAIESRGAPPRAKAVFFHETPLLNMGVVYGLVRSSAGAVKGAVTVSTSRSDSLGSRAQQLYAQTQAGCGFGTSVWNRCKNLLIDLNRDFLEKTPCPWYLPERYGGIGIPGRPTGKDLRLVSAAKLAGLEFTVKVNTAWQVWRLAQRKVDQWKAFEKQELSREEGMAADRAMALLVVDCLFDSSVNDSLLKDERELAKEAGRNNERLWRKLNSGAYGFPSIRKWKVVLGHYEIVDADWRVDGYRMLDSSHSRFEIWSANRDSMGGWLNVCADDDEVFVDEMVKMISTPRRGTALPFSVDLLLY